MEIGKPNPAWLRRQAAARAHQPKKIRLLLLGESPASEDGGFYLPGEMDPLFEEVCTVLLEEKPAGEKEPYLKELKRRGVFYADLKPDAPRAGETLADYVPPLLINLGILSPEHVVLITPAVYEAAYRPLTKAGLPVVDVRVPDPAQGAEFRQKLRQALVRADLEKLIRPRPKPKGAPKAS
jgi:hypothetical protein